MIDFLKGLARSISRLDTEIEIVLLSLLGVVGATAVFHVYPRLTSHTGRYALVVTGFLLVPEGLWVVARNGAAIRSYLLQRLRTRTAVVADPGDDQPSREESQGGLPPIVPLALWVLAVGVAFLSWQLLVTRAEQTPPLVTPTATPLATYVATPTVPSPTSTPIPSVAPTTVPPSKVAVPTPSVHATRLELLPGSSSGSLTLAVFMEGAPNPEAYYWVLREDLDYPVRNPSRPELYPQALSSWNTSNPYLDFAVFLQVLGRRYHLTVIECSQAGDDIVRPIADRWREEAFLDQFPRGCVAVIDAEFVVNK